MSIVRYCDSCHKKMKDEFQNEVDQRVEIDGISVSIWIRAIIGDDSRDVCLKCVKKFTSKAFEEAENE